MAAYASTVTVNTPWVVRLLSVFGLGIIFGKVNITNYNATTKPEITGITKYFRGDPIVVCSGVSSGAVKQLVRWDNSGKSLHCFVPTTGAETATDVNVGEVNFIAIGRVH